MNEPVPAEALPEPLAQRFCYGCGKPIHVSAVACPQCGAPQAQAGAVVVQRATPAPGREVFCRACGRAINVAAPLCPGCGAPQAPPRAIGGNRSRVAAALLALFLGGFGIHKFYLGHPLLGILYLVFCWTFIPAFIAFIEAIIYLCMSDENFARKYG